MHKTYDTARTPYQRLLKSGVLSTEQEAALQEAYQKLNPVKLKAQIDRNIDHLWTLARAEHKALSVTLSIDATRT